MKLIKGYENVHNYHRQNDLSNLKLITFVHFSTLESLVKTLQNNCLWPL